jgi:hypothetical protein
LYVQALKEETLQLRHIQKLLIMKEGRAQWLMGLCLNKEKKGKKMEG